MRFLMRLHIWTVISLVISSDIFFFSGSFLLCNFLFFFLRKVTFLRSWPAAHSGEELLHYPGFVVIRLWWQTRKLLIHPCPFLTDKFKHLIPEKLAVPYILTKETRLFSQLPYLITKNSTSSHIILPRGFSFIFFFIYF